MKLKFACYLKSGSVIYEENKLTEYATIKDAKDAIAPLENFVNDAIKNRLSGTFTVGNTHINIQEVSAYTLEIKGDEFD